MEYPVVAVATATSFAVTLTLLPPWIRAALRAGLAGRDMNKPGEILVAEAGGIAAVIGALMGIYIIVLYYKYFRGVDFHTTELFALSSLLLLAALIGFLDDVLGWKKGLPRWIRILAMAPASTPLVVIKAGVPTISLPLIGTVNLGILYPLLAVPIGVVGAANGFNMIGGYNGLEAGMGLILMASTAIYAAIKGIQLACLSSLVMAASLAAFLVYNWYPARVFPGNTLTYAVGAYYAGVVILGNFEKFGIALFMLYFVKAGMYFVGAIRGVWREGVEDFGVPQPDGTIKSPLRGPYSLQHLAIEILERVRGRATEVGVVSLILALQAALSVLLLILAYENLI
jgi:UDP-N-acetylglucosamine--dolichyl-phosphate N-acetylglucosaminephosphotransferase